MGHNTPLATVSLMNKLMDELFIPQSRGKRPPLVTPTSEQSEGSALRVVCHLQRQNPSFPSAAGCLLESSSSSLILFSLWCGLRWFRLEATCWQPGWRFLFLGDLCPGGRVEEGQGECSLPWGRSAAVD